MFARGDAVRCKWGSKWYDAVVEVVFEESAEYDVVFSDGSIGRAKALWLKARGEDPFRKFHSTSASKRSAPLSPSSSQGTKADSVPRKKQKLNTSGKGASSLSSAAPLTTSSLEPIIDASCAPHTLILGTHPSKISRHSETQSAGHTPSRWLGSTRIWQPTQFMVEYCRDGS